MLTHSKVMQVGLLCKIAIIFKKVFLRKQEYFALYENVSDNYRLIKLIIDVFTGKILDLFMQRNLVN